MSKILNIPGLTGSFYLFSWIGFGLYWTWVYTVMFGIQTEVVPLPNITFDSGFAFTVAVFFGMCLSQLLSALFSKTVAKILLSPLGTFVVAALRAVGTLGMLLANMLLSFSASVVLCVFSGLLAGVGSGCLLLLWGCAYGSMNQASLISTSSVSFIGALLLCYVLTVYASPVVVGAVAVVLPVVEGLFLSASLGKQVDTLVNAGDAPGGGKPILLLKSAFLAVTLGFAVGIFREISLTSLPSSANDPSQILILSGSLILAFLLIQLILRSEKKQPERYSLRIPLVLLSLTVILLFMLNDTNSLAYRIVELIGYFSFEVVIWAALVWLSRRLGISPFKVFGFGLGLIQIGQFLSPLSNSFRVLSSESLGLVHIIEPLILMFLLLIAIVLLSNEKGLQEVIAPTDALATQTTESDAYEDRLQAFSKHYLLSERELEVLRLLAGGRDVAHISKTLSISENTTKTHVKRIYAKTDVHSRRELMDLIDEVVQSDLVSS